MGSVTFIERMRLISNNKELVERTISNEFEKNKAARLDQLFKSLTFKYYEEIKMSIEYASTHGRKYSYMNFDKNDFKANFNGLGSPAKIQRKWLAEMCKPNSPYLISGNWVSWLDKDCPPVKRECFQGLNYDVWDNEKFTTVFSWDLGIDKRAMDYYHSRHWKNEEVTVDVWNPVPEPIEWMPPSTPRSSHTGHTGNRDTTPEQVRCIWTR
ncbi:hypothetical protein PGAG_00431 [Phaeocystis globosa virus 12T]|uniref:Uncharacterized protein n=1 Tax=Phaeocystis globosa virus PgV-16T TaxID=3071227 RepID=A0AC59EWG6_9VIRU|nr:hypothetical protein PGCG_00005 [Phaeocystis globosa virus]AET72885.1 hypothetical protein PGAG_00431 [Phaeocystis globosa virus 12T]AET73618.1 hypothetical protein PGBG_00402 [Phaeocystis globosa virus 14T]AGM15317.1 hypothetical protein PGCG_00005 [Phaeocystis globosa virus PgV-16T]UYE94047.1 hypothetical protein PGV14T_00005 [Phaeocystis globosa virus]